MGECNNDSRCRVRDEVVKIWNRFGEEFIPAICIVSGKRITIEAERVFTLGTRFEWFVLSFLILIERKFD